MLSKQSINRIIQGLFMMKITDKMFKNEYDAELIEYYELSEEIEKLMNVTNKSN